ncbi:MAG: tRNA uracil 4-sulfurtransferase ThiI, partial [Thermoanaerobaculia bacterium]|nr:tRNA uracil 4-sulfurtransferase ThiI [Thermoanaerobaculia bacterium]
MGTDRDLGETRLYLVRYTGEVTTKGRGTRIQFLRRLESHVREGLESTGLPFEVDRQWSRMLVEAPPVAAEEILPRIFGVHSISPTVRREGTSLEGIVEAGTELFRSKVAGKLFAVRARRSGERKESFRSGDVNRALGSSLLPFAEGVDLEEPEIVVRVEIRNGSAYFFEEKIPGPGGLPLGCEGPALALVSGGFDSAVASWAMLRRGARLDYLFCNLGGAKHRQGALQVMKLIADRWSHGSEPRLHEVDLRPLVEELRERCRSRYWQILLKRLMLHAGNHLARELRSEALVTGEVLGQVSSQTLRNLRVISEVAELPVLRPLAGRDKDEIVDLARRIGTYDLSAEVPEFCALDASKPATRARPGDVRKEEEKLDLGSIAEAVEAREVFDLRSLDASTLGIADLGVETPPPDARIVDVRSRTGFDAWHLPGAEHVEYFAALDGLDRFQGDRPVVFYCEVGLKSAHLAELLRDRGIEAYHFEAG